VRYRGRSGQWSWLAHRISGLAILTFLVVHVWDTANAFFYPEIYGWTIEIFKHPLFAGGEIALMAAVLYHAFNGIRITLLDFKPEWWIHQHTSAIITWALFFIVFIPIGLLMFVGIINHCTAMTAEGVSCWRFPPLSDFIQ
jgi:succinate dehydrogenase / fumarate reductase cytochrome b subunit